jgi:hypothetical protein
METTPSTRFNAMKKHTPQGIQVVMTALVVLLGVALLTPAVQAMDNSNDSGGANAYYVGGNSRASGGSGGTPSPVPGPGGEADPDWWQTDTWNGHQIGVAPAPAPQESRVPVLHPVTLVSVGPFGDLVTWIFNWTVRIIGSGR